MTKAKNLNLCNIRTAGKESFNHWRARKEAQRDYGCYPSRKIGKSIIDLVNVEEKICVESKSRKDLNSQNGMKRAINQVSDMINECKQTSFFIADKRRIEKCSLEFDLKSKQIIPKCNDDPSPEIKNLVKKLNTIINH